jgi:hypothetical protein
MLRWKTLIPKKKGAELDYEHQNSKTHSTAFSLEYPSFNGVSQMGVLLQKPDAFFRSACERRRFGW